MTGRLISEAQAIEALLKAFAFHNYAGTMAANVIRQLPTIEAEPTKHGKWWHYEGTLTCSVCHTEIYDDIMELLGDDVPNYCPNCGADMRGSKDE